ncbi:MAG: CRISPR-associated protein Cas4 [Helicobacteraceae bacterium]|jgi:CRISPR-associated exonuclease Cas4|nr:CRISPR-associated protein Cas4 [Helicobacteraceae bacterium]
MQVKGSLDTFVAENDLVQISALQHAMFCERQYALIHIERLWEENRFTAEGRALHERVHTDHRESRRSFLQEYDMSVRSLKFGLIGKCDLVEIWRDTKSHKPMRINPVEFKRGRKKENDVDRVQICAQVLCIEEMFNLTIETAEFYYLQEHRRTVANIDETLRAKTIALIDRIRTINENKKTPIANYEKKRCDPCSLIDLCMPKYTTKSVRRYMQNQIKAGLTSLCESC